MTNNENQTLVDDQNKDASIVDVNGGGGSNGNGSNESTPQIQFGSGPPFVNSSVPSAISTGLMPEKFNGNGFKTWQQNMLFFLTTLNLDKHLKENAPVLPSGNKDTFLLASVDSWTHSDFLCKGWILSRLIDPLYDVYTKVKSSKELWSALEKKYQSEDAGSQKFAVAKFLHFQMVDSKPIMDQVEELQLITHELANEGMSICEIFTVNCFIEKLPPSWVDFKHYLTHKRKAISLADLISKLRVEAQNRKCDAILLQENHVNMAEHKKKEKNKIPPQASSSFKKHAVAKKFSGTCHKCGKMGHKANVCRSKIDPHKDNGKSQANLIEDELCAIVTEVNDVEDNPMEWWYDTGATTHICMDKDMFKTYQKCKSEERLLMGNTGSSKIEGRGTVMLKMTSGRELTLKNVKHVPDMRKNLIFGTLLSKAGFAVIIESDKLVLKKNGVYLGKGYEKNGLVKMNVMTVFP